MPQKNLTYLSPAELKPYEKNPRINDGAVEAVKRSLVEFGFQNPIIADKKLNVIAGHTRLKAAQALGLKEVPVLIADQLTPAQIKAYRIADNQTGNIAKWDFELLPLEIAELEADGFDVTLLGFPDDELGRITQTENEGLTDPDEIPEAPEAITKAGDLWLLGEHRLLCGDSTRAEDVARVMGGKRASCVLTDPPYGINQDGVPNDEPEKLAALINGAVSCLPCDNGVICSFASTRTFPAWLDATRSNGFAFERMLWLYKQAQCSYPWRGWLLKSEAILVSSIGSPEWCDVHPYVHDTYLLSEVSGELPPGIGWHGSVKPMKVVLDLLSRVCSLSGIVFDPFLGSGTTLIAAEQLNRKCYGLEISPQYCDVICKRWEQFTGKKAVLEKV